MTLWKRQRQHRCRLLLQSVSASARSRIGLGIRPRQDHALSCVFDKPAPRLRLSVRKNDNYHISYSEWRWRRSLGQEKIFHTKDQTSSWRVCKILNLKKKAWAVVSVSSRAKIFLLHQKEKGCKTPPPPPFIFIFIFSLLNILLWGE